MLIYDWMSMKMCTRMLWAWLWLIGYVLMVDWLVWWSRESVGAWYVCLADVYSAVSSGVDWSLCIKCTTMRLCVLMCNSCGDYDNVACIISHCYNYFSVFVIAVFIVFVCRCCCCLCICFNGVACTISVAWIVSVIVLCVVWPATGRRVCGRRCGRGCGWDRGSMVWRLDDISL